MNNHSRIKCIIISVILTYSSTNSRAQNQQTIEWDKTISLQLQDFKSPETQIGGTEIYSIYMPSNIDFYFQMSNAEFMFTKNFNSKVTAIFSPDLGSIVAPDSAYAIQLLAYAQYNFDLVELYARKLRKRLFQEKGTFSDVRFFKPIYDEVIKEYTVQQSQASKETEIGKNAEKLKELHQVVLNDIDLLADFCKSCKPKKIKK
jgi:hypothetical protein